jgi:hypothetical protein
MPTLFLIGDSSVQVGTTGQVSWGERIADDFDPWGSVKGTGEETAAGPKAAEVPACSRMRGAP